MAATTTVQTAIDRAKHRNDNNRLSSLTSDTPRLLDVANRVQQQLHREVVSNNRTYFQAVGALTSSSGSSGRTASLASLTSPCARVLAVQLADGREVTPVDPQDVEADLAPRYFQRGTSLVEVANDWTPTSASAVVLTITYVTGAARLTSVSDVLAIDDNFADLVDNRLARYLFEKDVGRDPQEGADLDAEYAGRLAQYVESVSTVGGTTAQRFQIPAPAPETKA